MTDNNNASPSDDDLIPFVTGIPLIDADPKVIARRLGEKSWESRARFFSNIITGSVGNATKMGELYGEDVEGWRMEMALVLCGIHERVAEVLELWGVEDIHAACIYALSMSFEHRIKANAFFGSKGPILHDALIQKSLAESGHRASYFVVNSAGTVAALATPRRGLQLPARDWGCVMTELERRAQLADELSEIMMRMMRDTGVLTRIVSAFLEGKPVGPISAPERGFSFRLVSVLTHCARCNQRGSRSRECSLPDRLVARGNCGLEWPCG